MQEERGLKIELTYLPINTSRWLYCECLLHAGAAAGGREGADGPGEALGVAVGSRAHLEAAAIAKRHWYRNILMHGFHLIVVLVAGGAVRDTQCGFKVGMPPLEASIQDKSLEVAASAASDQLLSC